MPWSLKWSLVIWRSIVYDTILSTTHSCSYFSARVIQFGTYTSRAWWRNEDIGPILKAQYTKKSIVEDPHSEVAFGAHFEDCIFEIHKAQGKVSHFCCLTLSLLVGRIFIGIRVKPKNIHGLIKSPDIALSLREPRYSSNCSLRERPRYSSNRSLRVGHIRPKIKSKSKSNIEYSKAKLGDQDKIPRLIVFKGETGKMAQVFEVQQEDPDWAQE